MLRALSRSLHIGQEIPNVRLVVVSRKGNNYEIEKPTDSSEVLHKGPVVLVGYPGAFTPTCQSKHIPGFVNLYDEFKAKGYEVLPLAVNDPFVIKEFAQELGGKMPYIADGSGELTAALEAGVDLSAHSLGFRTRRFTAVIRNGKVEMLNDEGGPGFTDISTAETVLMSLDAN